MNGTFVFCLALLMGASAASQEARMPEDVIQLKDGALLVGKVLELGDDAVRIALNGEKEPRRVPLKEIQPYTVYRLRLERIDRASPSAHFELGTYCLENGLRGTALREFQEAARVHSRLSDEMKKARAEESAREAQALLAHAGSLLSQEKYFGANDLLERVVRDYEGHSVSEAARLKAEFEKGIPQSLAEAFDQGARFYKAARETGEKLMKPNPYRFLKVLETHGGRVKAKYTHVFYLPATADVLFSGDGIKLMKERVDSANKDEAGFAQDCLKVLSCPDRLRESDLESLPVPIKGEYAVFYFR